MLQLEIFRKNNQLPSRALPAMDDKISDETKHRTTSLHFVEIEPCAKIKQIKPQTLSTNKKSNFEEISNLSI